MAEEKEFLGARKGKMWTYLILLVVLIAGALIANLVLSNPTVAKHGVHSFLGLPGWALAAITFVIGLGVFWMGLKVETDWPEAFGAFLMAGSVCAGEVMIGWKRFAPAGLFIIPYLIPIAVFLLLLMYGMKRSV